MTESVLRAGIIGGGVGRSHAKGYQSNANAQLVAFCDVDEEKIKTFSSEYHVPPEGGYTDYRHMLADAHLDIVSVCLPNYLHAEVTIAALEAGVHVICEKPMATSAAEAQHMIDAAQKADRRLVICYNYRYREDVQWVQRVIKAGTIGAVHHISATWRRETGIPGRGWFVSKKMAGGGALIDLGVHVLDLAQWLMDFPEVQTVSGATRSLFGAHGLKTWGRKPGSMGETQFDVEDGAIGFIRFANGANAVLQATWAEHRQPQDDLIHIEIQGAQGTIVLSIENYTIENTLRLYTEIEGEPVTIIPGLRASGKAWGHDKFVSATVDAIHNGTPPPSDGEQGLADVRVLEAMYQSALSGHEVSLSAVIAPEHT